MRFFQSANRDSETRPTDSYTNQMDRGAKVKRQVCYAEKLKSVTLNVKIGQTALADRILCSKFQACRSRKPSLEHSALLSYGRLGSVGGSLLGTRSSWWPAGGAVGAGWGWGRFPLAAASKSAASGIARIVIA